MKNADGHLVVHKFQNGRQSMLKQFDNVIRILRREVGMDIVLIKDNMNGFCFNEAELR